MSKHMDLYTAQGPLQYSIYLCSLFILCTILDTVVGTNSTLYIASN